MPALTSMVAASPYAVPATYAAAPTMTSMYATPSASMYMPAATMAAPTVVETFVAPQQFIQQAPSYVAAPQQVIVAAQAPSYVAAPQQVIVAAPRAPSFVAAPVVEIMAFPVPVPLKLTEGLVPPDQIEKERLAYEKALAAQLKKQSDATFAEAKLKKAMMEQAKNTQLAQFQLQAEEQLKLACLQAEQEALMMVDGLKEAAITQQTIREEAAARAVADFNKKKSMEDYQAKSWKIQKDWFDQEQKMTSEYQAAMQEGQRVLGNYNAGQVNVNAPGRMASYAAAPQYTTLAAAPQYTTVAAPQMM